jgi:hypothetical protein
MTEPISPAALAVLRAYMNNCGWLDGPLKKDYQCAAAVLRAAADQVVPEPDDIDKGSLSLSAIRNRCKVRDQLLAIAAELEALRIIATPEQWETIEKYAYDNTYDACFLELRARIEALEAAQPKIRSGPESPLVERVADAIAAQATSAGIVNDRPARAAILEVAAWLRTESEGHLGSGLHWAKRLEQEANR